MNASQKRVNAVLAGKSRPIHAMFIDEWAIMWKNAVEEDPSLLASIRGNDVYDIGCGKHGGLAPLLLGAGARSYTGIDIDSWNIDWSAIKVQDPRAKFICDDPVHILRSRKRPVTVVSSSFFDTMLLPDSAYSRSLIESIYAVTPSGGLSFHNVADEELEDVFQEVGFTRPQMLCGALVYRK